MNAREMARSDPGRSGLPGAMHPSHIDFRPVQKTSTFVASLLQPSKRERLCSVRVVTIPSSESGSRCYLANSGFIRGIPINAD